MYTDIFKTQAEELQDLLNDEMTLHDIMCGHFIPLNSATIKLFGLDAALMFAAIYEEFSYRRTRDTAVTLTTPIRFSIACAKDRTGLSKDRQAKALKKLKEYGLISSYSKGLPSKRFVCFNRYHWDSIHGSQNSMKWLQKEVNNIYIVSDEEHEARIKEHEKIKAKIATWNESRWNSAIASLEFENEQNIA